MYFVKQLAVRDKDGAEDGEEAEARVIPMLREYVVFNVEQCEGLPARVTAPSNVRPRNRDERDATIDEFLACTDANVGIVSV